MSTPRPPGLSAPLLFAALALSILSPSASAASPTEPPVIFVWVTMTPDESWFAGGEQTLGSISRTIEGRLARGGRVRLADQVWPDGCPRADPGCARAAAQHTGAAFLIEVALRRIGPQTLEITATFHDLAQGSARTPRRFEGRGRDLWQALPEPVEAMSAELAAWMALDPQWRWRTPPREEDALWLHTQLALVPIGAGRAGPGFSEGASLALQMGAMWRLAHLGLGLDLGIVPRLALDPAPFDDGLERLQLNLGGRLEWAINHAELTGNFHLTELAWFAGASGGYSTITRSVLDGGLDLEPGLYGQVEIGVAGMATPFLELRGALSWQRYRVERPAATIEGDRLLVIVGVALGFGGGVWSELQ